MTRAIQHKMPAAVLLVLLALCGGCSTVPKLGPDSKEPLRRYEDVVKIPPGQQPLLLMNDPIEGFNRGAYRFNYYFDKYLFLPVVNAYRFVMPDYLEKRVSNFFDNITEITNLANSLLQFKGKKPASPPPALPSIPPSASRASGIPRRTGGCGARTRIWARLLVSTGSAGAPM